MTQVCLVHWNEEAALVQAQLLKDLGYEVLSAPGTGSTFFHYLEQNEPAVILIDLTRIPSQGRDLGVALRMRKGTRRIPIVFVGGAQDKIQSIRELLPDAHYCNWAHVETTMIEAQRSDMDEVLVPDSVFAAYARKPLSIKLGININTVLACVNAPEYFLPTLGDLPEGVSITEAPDESAQLAVWFVRDEGDLRSNLDQIIELSRRIPVWVAWPKKGSVLEADLSQPRLREICMEVGLVDYKICSIDDIWSALLFTWRG